MTSNPLLEFSALPRFAEIRPEHAAPAIDALLAEARAAEAHAAAPDTPATWAGFVEPLEDATERLSRAWSLVAHLHAVMDSAPLRETYNAILPRITQYWTDLGQNEALFAKYRALKAGGEWTALSPARKTIVEHALRDFRLGGAELPPGPKARFAAIQEELAALGARFSENVLDATNAWSIVIEDAARVAGIPPDALAEARAAAEKDGASGWKFTLHMPSYLPVMQYADDRPLRETLYRENVTRASEFGRSEWDNGPLIGRLLRLRHEEAQLLAYPNFAELSLVPKMATSAAAVIAFLDDLARRARPHGERDAAELRAFARDTLSIDALQAWDLAYASEKLRAQRYAFSDEEVKQYFPEDAVCTGMFRVVERIYGLRVEPVTDRAEAPVWDEDVRFYSLRDAGGALVGQFYLDLYARETKQGGAWMDDARARRRLGDTIQTPVAYLNCNFSRPLATATGTRPALFTHDEVITLFHEFGHGLHHLLTQIEDLGVSGIRGVEWDAVELPSQFMENFCWEWNVLSGMTRHVDTGAALPRALFDKMIAARNFQSGLATLRQIEFSEFDMRLHADFDPAGSKTPLELLDEVRARVAVLRSPPFNRFLNSFSHIFGGGYAAGYYSYKWAEVLSADAYSLFEAQHGPDGVLDAATGERFRREILAVGGSRPAAESFEAFRGRAPQVDALLRHNGMLETTAPAA